MRLIVTVWVGLLLLHGATAADWASYEGGTARHNASATPVTSARHLWTRTFPAFEHERIAPREGSGYASRNLVSHGDYLAVIGVAADEGIPNDRRDSFAQLSILNRLSGRTEGIFQTRARTGCNSVHRGRLPTGYFGNAVDVPGGFQTLHWRAGGELFLVAGGDSPAMSALRPLPALASWKPGSILPLCGAFADLDGNQVDVRGRRRSEVFAPMHKWPAGKGEPMIGLGDDWLDFKGSNRSSFFSLDPHSPVIAFASGGHQQGTRMMLLSQDHGLSIKKLNEAPLGTCFSFRDPVIVFDGVLYAIGPSQDADGSGDLGNVYGLGETRPKKGSGGKFVFAENDPGGPDQGLKIWALKLRFQGDKVVGTDRLFSCDFPSAHLPRRGAHDAYSYVETDGQQRDKSIALDDGRLWVAWKPSLEGPVSLAWADAESHGSIELNVGQGIRGNCIWPRMSLTGVGGRKHIAYLLGNAYERSYQHPTYPWSAETGSWAEKPEAPSGPSALALVDIENRKLRWTVDLSAAHPSLPINDFWLHADRIQMLVAGETAWIAWVDFRRKQAELRLAAYDLAGDQPACEEHSIPLPFNSSAAPRSYCTDLIAVDGMLYALLTESTTMWPRAWAKDHYNWTAQHVVAIGDG